VQSMRSLFFGVILGILLTVAIGWSASKYYGYFVVPAASYLTYKAASEVLDRVRLKNSERKNGLQNKTAKKAGKRLASTAIAAGTVGTIAVIGAGTIFLIEDHCDELAEINELNQLIEDSNEGFDYQVCFEETKEYVDIWKDEAKDYAEENWRSIVEKSGESWANIKGAIGWPWF